MTRTEFNDRCRGMGSMIDVEERKIVWHIEMLLDRMTKFFSNEFFSCFFFWLSLFIGSTIEIWPRLNHWNLTSTSIIKTCPRFLSLRPVLDPCHWDRSLIFCHWDLSLIFCHQDLSLIFCHWNHSKSNNNRYRRLTSMDRHWGTISNEINGQTSRRWFRTGLIGRQRSRSDFNELTSICNLDRAKGFKYFTDNNQESIKVILWTMHCGCFACLVVRSVCVDVCGRIVCWCVWMDCVFLGFGF